MVLDYINYFRSLAIAHKDLRHNPLSETGDGPVGSMHFTKVSPEQVLKALRTGIGFPCMAIELYDTQMESQVSSDIKPKTSGAFMIIDNPASQSAADEDAVFGKTERVTYDILKQIYQDVLSPGADDECAAPFEFFEFDKLSITPVSRIFGGQSGYRTVFDFELKKTLNINVPPEAGTFLIDES